MNKSSIKLRVVLFCMILGGLAEAAAQSIAPDSASVPNKASAAPGRDLLRTQFEAHRAAVAAALAQSASAAPAASPAAGGGGAASAPAPASAAAETKE